MINKVKIYREQKQISQDVLAKQVGISRQNLSLIESNKKLPQLELGLKLSQALGVSVENLFSESHNADSVKVTGLSRIERLLLANQFKILQKLHSGDESAVRHYRHEEQVFERGYVYLYQEAFDKLVKEFDIAVSEEVVSILDLHRAMLWSLGNNPKPKELEQVQFRGFDGVNEYSYLSFARFFVSERQNYNDLEIVSSPCPTLNRYRKMLGEWSKIHKRPKLNGKEIVKVLQAGEG